jgi:hypothetical protein
MPGHNLLPELAGSGRQVTPGASVAPGRNLFEPTAEEQRAERLKKIALGAMEAAGGASGRSDIFSDAVTFGLQKPVSGLSEGVGGLIRSAFGQGDDSTFGERYRAGTAAYDERQNEAWKNAGWTGYPAAAAGMLTGGGAGKAGPLARQGGSWIGEQLMKIPGVSSAAEYVAGKPLVQAGISGGTAGGIEGAARNSEDLGSSIAGAGLGIVTGAPTGMLLHALIDRFANSGARKAASVEQSGPEPSVLRQQAKTAYGKLDNAGVFYDMGQSADFGSRITNALDTAKFDPGLHPKAAALVDRIRKDTTGRPLSMTNLQTLRELTSDVLKNPDPSERRIGNAIASTLDDWVEGTQPAMGNMGGPEIAQTWKDARTLWRSARTAEDIGWTLNKAINRAARTNSGQNTENAIRQNIGAVLDRELKPGSPSKYNPVEEQMMEQIVKGTGPQNAMRTVGNWLQSVPGAAGIASAAVPAALHGLTSGNLPMAGLSLAAPLAAWGTSRFLKKGASDIAEEGVNRLIGTIASGGRVPPTWDYILQGPPTRAKLALMQALKQVPMVGGMVTGQAGAGQ